ncbi:MAG: hypothetical protein JW946_01355 [Candidatus Omnitrophica bacterium]|nr:hypothetical protein [Candidatus Omnitrophota bacterium]
MLKFLKIIITIAIAINNSQALALNQPLNSHALRPLTATLAEETVFINNVERGTIALEPKQVENLLGRITASPGLHGQLNGIFEQDDEFIDFFLNPGNFIERCNDDGLLVMLCNFMTSLLSNNDILGEIPICNYAGLRAQAERIAEQLAIRLGRLENILSDRTLYKHTRADNLLNMAKEYAVDPSLVYYLDIRHSGITILGSDASLLYTENGKYKTVDGILNNILFFSTRKVFLGDSPYVYSVGTGKLYYYGRPLDISCDFCKIPNESENWYFKQIWRNGIPTDEVDTSYLVINFRNFCKTPCPFCRRASGERERCFGLTAMQNQNISVDEGLSQIETAHGKDIFRTIQKISVMEAGFATEEEEVVFLKDLIAKLKARGFTGKITPFTSFLRAQQSFRELIKCGYSMDECLFPLECFTRREEVLGARKNSTFEESLEWMKVAKKYYKSVRVFLLIGLADNLDDLNKFIPILLENDIQIQLSSYAVALPRQRNLLCYDIVRDERNNGHIRFLLEAVKIAFENGVSCPEAVVMNGVWPMHADSLIHLNSPLRTQRAQHNLPFTGLLETAA